MIIANKVGNILDGPETHVAFAINTEGVGDVGLAGLVGVTLWPELFDIGPQELGTTLTKDVGRKVLHAMVVHHRVIGGWADAPTHIQGCFDRLDLPTDELVASVAMGAGEVGRLSGADSEANLAAMKRSIANIVLYRLPSDPFRIPGF